MQHARRGRRANSCVRPRTATKGRPVTERPLRLIVAAFPTASVVFWQRSSCGHGEMCKSSALDAVEHVNDLTFSGKALSSGVWKRTSCPASDILSMDAVEGGCNRPESESDLCLLGRLADRSVSCTGLL